jgi:FkbM family methyltransferase
VPSYSDLFPHFGRNLAVIDVGCRWGFGDIWTPLFPHISIYGFDPDAAECERLSQLYPGRQVKFVPQGLADTVGRRQLYVTQNPGCSSLFRPDPILTSSLPELACAAHTSTADVPVTTLDHWAAEAGVGEIDFIKLDTQGAELDILRGGENLLRTVRALEVEVEFNPIYEGQPLFGDIDRFLRERGFVLWRLSSLVHYSRDPARRQRELDDKTYYDSAPVPSRTFGGQLFWGLAHYVRSEIATAKPTGDRSQITRDAALMRALGFEKLEAELLRAAK